MEANKVMTVEMQHIFMVAQVVVAQVALVGMVMLNMREWLALVVLVLRAILPERFFGMRAVAVVHMLTMRI